MRCRLGALADAGEGRARLGVRALGPARIERGGVAHDWHCRARLTSPRGQTGSSTGADRIGDPVELVSFDRCAAAAPLDEAGRLDLAEAHPEDQVEAAPSFAQCEAGRREQRLGRLRLENPAHPLLGLHDRDRRVAVIGHQRRERVALGQDEGSVLGASFRIEIARKLAKALEPHGRIRPPKRKGAGQGFGEGQRREGKPNRRGPQRGPGDRAGKA